MHTKKLHLQQLNHAVVVLHVSVLLLQAKPVPTIILQL